MHRVDADVFFVALKQDTHTCRRTAGCLRGEGGRTITHSASDRTNCSRPAGARGFVFHPFFWGPAVV